MLLTGGSPFVTLARVTLRPIGTLTTTLVLLSGSYFLRAFNASRVRFRWSSFCPASPSFPSAVSRW
jgi:hypothetical protein